MKRNIDLLRDLLIQVESTNDNSEYKNPWVMFSAKDASLAEINYHALLLSDRGFFYSSST